MGRVLSPSGSLTFNVNRSGSNSWSTSTLPAWLSLNKYTGAIGDAGDSVTLTADTTLMPVGATSGTFDIIVSNGGQSARRSITVNVLKDTRKLIASENGVAFTQTPSWSRLTRSVVIRDNFGSGSWTASSDKSWLSVTSSGVSGGTLTLTANPAGLALDQTQLATVTVISNQGASSETIAVGLWNGSATPSTIRVVSTRYRQVVSDPVQPLVYVTDYASKVDVYNVYTASLVGSMSVPGTTLGSMVISSDGRRLYALSTSGDVIEIDPVSRSIVATRNWYITNSLGVYMRPNGEGFLLARNSPTSFYATPRIFRLSDGVEMSSTTVFEPNLLAISPDQKTLAIDLGGLTSGWITTFAIDYSAVLSKLSVSPLITNPDIGDFSNDMAFSGDGVSIYTASQTPRSGTGRGFGRFLTSDLSFSRILACPDLDVPGSVQISSDGRIFAGATNIYTGEVLRVYRADNSLQYTYTLATSFSGFQQKVVPSGDGLMAVSATAAPNLQFIPVGL